MSDEDDALPPSIPRTSTSAFRTRSQRPSQRTSTEQPRSKHSKQSTLRTPNDVRVEPASQDVISDLLNAFSTISPKADSFSPAGIEPDYTSRTFTARHSRTSSKGSTNTYNLNPSLRPLSYAYTNDFVEIHHPADNPEDLAPDEDAAEPPVVRTSRPPSGFTRSTSKGSGSGTRSLARKMSSPRLLLSPQSERDAQQQDSSAPSPQVGSRSPRQLLSTRTSTDTWANGTGIISATPTYDTKGKGREAYSSRANSLRSAAYESQRAAGGGGPFFSSSPSIRGSAGPSSRTSIDNDRPLGVAGPSFSKGATILEDRVDEAPEYASQAISDRRYFTETKDGRLIPHRTSSLLSSSETSPVKTRFTSRSNKSSPAQPSKQNKTIPEEQFAPPKRVILDDDSDDNQVSRRIRELKAAREQRAMSKDDNPDRHPAPRLGTRGPDQIPAGVRGLSTKTSSSLREAPEVEEHKISDETERQKDNYSLNVPPTFITVSKPTQQPQSPRHASRDRGGKGLNSLTRATPRPSYETPKHSRNNSRSRRWSPLTLANKPDPTRNIESDRTQTLLSQRATSTDTRRTSVDSVRASVKEYLSSRRLTQKIVIPGEGRTVVFSEVGDPKGYVVLCCVGMGLTRYVMAFYDELATSLGLRLITPDRPGIGDSDGYADGARTPMSWPDDVQAICDHLRITKFSLLAHSAGAIYALATALRLPHYLRGNIHLLAPWIPPSQLIPSTNNINRSAAPAGVLPKSQRFLRMLPSSFLKLSNSSFASFSRNNSPKPNKSNRGRRSTESAGKAEVRAGNIPPVPALNLPSSFSTTELRAPTIRDTQPPSPHLDSFRHVPTDQHRIASALKSGETSPLPETLDGQKQRQKAFDETLTPMIWDLATTNANPSVDLLICLERHRTIGFSYVDVGANPATNTIGERPGRIIDLGAEVDGNQWPGMGVVIRHGSKDNRVPVENIRWLSQRMVKCQVVILDGLGHGLMGEAGVMASVLSDISKEWDGHGGWKGKRRM